MKTRSRSISSFFTVLTLLASLLSSALTVTPASAAGAILVNSNLDIIADDDTCTLREAITNANGDSQLYATVDECAAGSGTDTITFAANYTITLASQLPAVTTPIIINGNGAANTIIQANELANTATYRIFQVINTGNLTLDSLTVRNGRCNGSCTIAINDGAGIYNAGVLTITNSTVFANSAATWAGGIYNQGVLTITNSDLSDNVANNRGGGLHNSGTATVTNSTFSDNFATTTVGGGIRNSGGTLTVMNSTFSGNTAATNGGSISTFGGTVTVTNSTFSGNTATSGNGGSIQQVDGTLTVTNSTFSWNTAGTAGGGIDIGGGTATLKNTIVANNTANNTGGNCSGAIAITNGGNNLEDGTTCGWTNVNNSISSTNPNIDGLANNGATTQTFALLAGSPATDAGNSTVCAEIATVNNLDQRGVTRPLGAACDIGAFESTQQISADLIVNVGDDSDDGSCDHYYFSGLYDCTLREAINAANTISGTNTITFDAALDTIPITLVGIQLPAVLDTLVINGNGAANTIIQANAVANTEAYHSTPSYRVLQVGNTGDLTLDSLTVRNGNCTNACFIDADRGGGIWSEGALTVTNSVVSGNYADFKGGGIYIAAGTLSVAGSDISGNSSWIGAGIANDGANTVIVANSIFSDNIAGSYSGGIDTNGALTVTNSTFSGNSAAYGGAIAGYGNPKTIVNSTFSGNSAIQGSAIRSLNYPVNITNSTFSGNSADAGGGTISLYIGTATLKNTIIANNTGGDCTVENTSTFVADIHNLDSDGSCGGATQKTVAEIGLEALQDNAGASTGSGQVIQTMALGANSAALDAGDDAICAAAPINALDQRGTARPAAGCDIGAYEEIPKALITFIGLTNPLAAAVITGTNIALTVPDGTDAANLVTIFTTTGTSVKVGGVTQVSGITANDFSSPVTYTVTAADGLTRDYIVTVALVSSTTKAISAFGFASPAATGIITGTDIAITVPYGTDVTALTPTITHNGASVSPDSDITQNFTNPVTYTVTASNTTTQDYTVTVTVAANTAKEISAFSFDSVPATGVITGTNIEVTVPFGTDVTALAATFNTSGASVKVGATTQTSGSTTNNFSGLVVYTVTADDNSTQNYVVAVTVAADTAKAMTAFGFTIPTPTDTITEATHTIAVTVPYGTDITALVAIFNTSGASVKVGGVTQASGITPNDFTNPVTYTVVAANGSTQDYVVTITVAANTTKEISAFSFASPAATGIISGTNIAITVPYGTNVTTLTPTITHSGATVSPNSGVAQNFTNPVTYTVTAADTSTQDYTVTVTVAANTAKAISAFSFDSVPATGVISGTNITVTVPYGTDVTALVATFNTSGASVKVGAATQTSGSTANNFTNLVTYTVTAGNNSTQDYVVVVTVAANSTKAITAFGFTIPTPTDTINEAAHTILVTVPYGTDLTSLVAIFNISGASLKVSAVVQVNGITPNDFTNPVTYTVTAANGSTQDYAVTVATAPDVLSITRVNSSPINVASVDFTVTFSESVTGVDVSDFSLTTIGVSGANVSGISGSGSIYTVTVSTGTGSGTIRLDVLDDNSIIADKANSPLSSGFISGQIYTIDKAAPAVSDSVRTNASPTNLTSVDFTVTFSESVTGVDTSDFSLTTTGVTSAAVSGISGSGSLYTVSINTGTGSGTIRLNVVNDNSIMDAALNPLSAGFSGGQTYTVSKAATVATFEDVPLTYWASSFVERLYSAGITSGCSVVPLNYCPDATVTREQMAVFLLRSKHGSSYIPPTADGTVFGDVPASSIYAPWIEQLAAEGITDGCGNSNYCPTAPVTRAQMAVFLLKAKNGSGYTPPVIGDGSGFTDVPDDHWAAAWIKQLATDGITGGCAAGIYCPENPVTRAQMAIFIVKTFNLP
ncbi:MAG: hypothetical protein CVU44_19890 [Chloroflexi bacterium HGW-Chloroflexi-6]|nr:MAG: hypothetical protein CVU44_19890 [Chloroflexi bacterium HGW-Chloroflexi-6]